MRVRQANISLSDSSWARQDQVLGSFQRYPHSCIGASEVWTSRSHSSTEAFWKLWPYGIQRGFPRRVHLNHGCNTENGIVELTGKRNKTNVRGWHGPRVKHKVVRIKAHPNGTRTEKWKQQSETRENQEKSQRAGDTEKAHFHKKKGPGIVHLKQVKPRRKERKRDQAPTERRALSEKLHRIFVAANLQHVGHLRGRKGTGETHQPVNQRDDHSS